MKLNQQLAHFAEDAHPYCTWCFFYPMTEMPRESYEHFFFSCPTSNRIITEYLDGIFDDQHLDLKKLIFNGHEAEKNFEILYLNIEVSLLLYFLYNYKFRKIIPAVGPISISIAITKNVMINSIKYRRICEWIKEKKGGKCQDHLNLLNKVP